jgi:hypothetical protein
VGFEPTTFSLEGRQDIDLKSYREYLDEKYSKQYACLMQILVVGFAGALDDRT